MKLLHQLFDVDREETAGEILFFRAFELSVLYWIVQFAWSWGLYIQRIGDVVLPLGIAQYVDVSFMFNHQVSLVTALLITVAAGLGFTRLWRYGYLAALLLLHLQYVARYCLGEISHGSNLIGVTLVGLSLGAVAFQDPRLVRRFVLGFCYFFFGLGYTSAAFCKLIATGPTWVDGRHLWMWIGERTVDTFSISGVIDHNLLQLWALDAHWLATMILAFGLLAEFFGFLIWFKRPRHVVLTLLLGMHLGILVSMKINFPANTHLLVLLAVPWPLLIDKWVAHLDAATAGRLRRLTHRLA